MKKKTLLFLLLVTASYSLRAQSSIIGQVLSESDSTAIGGVSIVNSIDGKVLTKSDNDGVFKINSSKGIESLILSHIAYQMDTVRLTQTTGHIVVYLQPDSHIISEIVVSTGYESLNTRKTTGSYTLVNNELLNRSVTPDILSRLEGVTNSLSFTRKDLVGERERTPELRVRGKSTIHGDGSPLIVLDNFPYEGQLNSINPNDIQDITILKDAAAAAIWGARAGNGVIVINTKKGGINRRPVVSFNSNVTIGERPNLLYSPLFMAATDFLEVEKELYRRGFFDNPDDRTVLSPVVEMLIKDGETPSIATKAAMDQLAEIDFRNEASRLFYQQKVNQQYAVNFQGGADRFGYYISGGYDANRANIKRNSDNRVTLLTQFNVKLTNKLEVNLGLNLVASQVAANGLGLASMVSSGKAALLPYTTFLDEAGIPSVINHNYRQLYVDNAEAMGLLNWQYRPLEEQALGNSVSKATESRANAAISYQIVPSLRLDARYQYHRILNDHATNFHESSFYARDLVNRFTQQDGTQIIPEGAVLEGSNSETTDHAFRTQANIDKTLNGMHEITGLMGFEMRQTKTIGSPGYLLYGVDNDILVGKSRLDYSIAHSTRPQGRASIPAPQTAQRYLIDRYLSYYANISYLYGGKYGFSASARQDGSNLFGVKYNQKFVPLWSAGFAWIVSEESFVDWGIDTFLKLRATYGYSGNVDKSATAFPTATYSADPRSGLLSAIIRSPGNPSLRWEKVQTLNFGTDFSVLSGRLAGSVDYYVKRGLDLIGNDVSDPTTGLGFPALQGGTLSNRINYANTKTKGLDVEVTSENLRGKFRWSTALLANYVNNLITTYRGTDDPNILAYTVTTGPISPMEGRPIDPLYSLPWYGLNPDDGSPLVRVDGTLSNQYGQFINQLTHADLILSGSSIPKWFGSIRNTFGWGDLSLSFNISWKSGYYFRPSSIDYNSLFSQWLGHRDFADRWLKPGDEKFTNVPSMPSLETYDASGRMDLVYTRSNILVEKGDHLRLRDINVNYTFHKSTFRRLPFQSMILTLYMQNLGILWRANSKGIDPDVPNASYPNPTAYAVGLNVNF